MATATETAATTSAISSPPATPLTTPFDPSTQVIHELHLNKDVEEWLQSFAPGILQNYKDIESTWNYPLTQFSITLVRDAEFRGAVTDIHNQHAVSTLLGYEALLILVFWIFRAYRLNKVSTWLTRIWTQAWVGAVFWILAVGAVPYLVWGSAYRVFVTQLFKAGVRHFMA